MMIKMRSRRSNSLPAQQPSNIHLLSAMRRSGRLITIVFDAEGVADVVAGVILEGRADTFRSLIPGCQTRHGSGTSFRHSADQNESDKLATGKISKPYVCSWTSESVKTRVFGFHEPKNQDSVSVLGNQ